jgi:ferredoxin-NADP reductase
VRRDHGYHDLRVKRVVDETGDTRSFVLDVPSDLRERFRYRAGQFCTFRTRIGGDEHLRCYSMSSAPETDDDLTVTVKRVPGGLVSNWFNDRVAAGDVLETTVPAGVFCVRESSRPGRPIVALCGGSGVTPVMSIAKSALAATDRPVRVLYANRDRDSVIFDEDLRDLRDRHPDRLDVRLHFDTDGGYLDRGAVAAFVDGSLDGDFYVCGPGPFMDLVEETLVGLGVGPDRILIERFVTPDGLPPDTAAPPAEASDADASEGAGDVDVTETVVLILKGKETSVPYRPGDTVLETARRGGLTPPFSCQAGDCATCMALVREGSAEMRANNALTPEEVEEGWVLTCQALPRGRSVTVEYESY